jgi:hypothetical protein
MNGSSPPGPTGTIFSIMADGKLMQAGFPSPQAAEGYAIGLFDKGYRRVEIVDRISGHVVKRVMPPVSRAGSSEIQASCSRSRIATSGPSAWIVDHPRERASLNITHSTRLLRRERYSLPAAAGFRHLGRVAGWPFLGVGDEGNSYHRSAVAGLMPLAIAQTYAPESQTSITSQWQIVPQTNMRC